MSGAPRLIGPGGLGPASALDRRLPAGVLWAAVLWAIVLLALVLAVTGASAQPAPDEPWPTDWAWRPWTDAPAGSAGVQALSQAADGGIWVRLDGADGADEPRVAALRPSGETMVQPAPIRTVVEANLALIRKLGSLEGLWSVDAGGRVWVGPAYHDGRRWTVLARDGTLGTARLDYGWDTLIDGRGNLWVPYRLQREGCSDPAACVEDGLRAFGPEGPRQQVLALAPSAAAEQLGAGRHSLMSWGSDAWALAPGSALRPPLDQVLDYPLLGPPEMGQLRNAGYATGAWRGPLGGPQVPLWVELQERTGIRELQLLATWNAATAAWEQEELTDCPVLAAPRRAPRLTAGARGQLGGVAALWLGSNRGEVALRWASDWWQWDAAALGLPSTPVRAMLTDKSGQLWLGGTGGLVRFGPPESAEPPGLVFLPGLRR